VSRSFFVSVLTATLTYRSVRARGCIVGRTKFSGWERHLSEYRARIVLFAGYTNLIGYTVFCCIYKILCGTYYANYREDSQRYSQESFIGVIVTERARKRCTNAIGNIATATMAARVAIVIFVCFNVQNDRVYRFYNCPLIGMRYAIIKSEKLRK
jgi:hypothetical protein